mgnify:FL=1|jgi:hypothetical protein|tara:strand:- start:78 stop:422 length:345 start_codon:yes stop_codon:yes gene_type:complete
MNYNNDFKHDLKLGQVKERELGAIFDETTIEIKHDLRALETGNVYIEYMSRGKLSGISTTQAKWYCIAIGNTFHLIKTIDLQYRCKKYANTWRNKKGGDNNTSWGILLPIIDLI